MRRLQGSLLNKIRSTSLLLRKQSQSVHNIIVPSIFSGLNKFHLTSLLLNLFDKYSSDMTAAMTLVVLNN